GLVRRTRRRQSSFCSRRLECRSDTFLFYTNMAHSRLICAKISAISAGTALSSRSRKNTLTAQSYASANSARRMLLYVQIFCTVTSILLPEWLNFLDQRTSISLSASLPRSCFFPSRPKAKTLRLHRNLCV